MATVSEALAAALQHHQAGRLQAAEQLYRQIIAIDPQQVDALHLLGVAYSQMGNQDSAIEYIQRAIGLKDTAATFHSNLASAYKAQGKTEEAVSAYRRAVELNPHSAVIHSNLGAALEQQGKIDEAVDCFRRALQLDPAYAAAQYNLGSVFQAQGKLDEAIDCFRTAAQLDPRHAEACNNLGKALHDQGRLDEAAAALRRAIELKPALVEAHNNLGNVYQALDTPEEAVKCYRRALELKPDYAEAYSNLANAFKQLRRFDDALASYDRALDIDAQYATAHCGRAMLRLMLGDFSGGWPEYEWRWGMRSALRRQFSQPRWEGNPLGEQTILLHDEQGFGDTIQFIRYAALVKNQNPAATIVVECQRPLVPLLSGCAEVDRLVARGDELPAFDVYAPLLSLPAIFRTSPESVPANGPYLSADPTLAAQWKERLAPLQGLRVGINWHGRPGPGEFSRRNVPLSYFAPLAALPGVTLISLQKGEGCEQLGAAMASGLAIVDLGHNLDNVHGAFTDTAAIMLNLDLVITSDTSVPHVAGALGVPVWLALPFISDWRWMTDRSDSPWYPSMRLFRQKNRGDWSEVFEELRRNLAAFTPR